MEPRSPSPPPSPLSRILDEDLYRCVHCGLCLSACPTYVETGLETESPRGRIALMKALREGRVDVTPRVVSHWDMCLGCRACEVACPSGVPYGRLIEGVREEVSLRGAASWRQRLIGAVFLRGLLPRQRLLRALARLLWAYQRWGLRAAVRGSRILRLMPGRLAEMEGQLPEIPGRFFGPWTGALPPIDSDRKLTVGLLSGCVMPLVQGPTMAAATRVLRRNGCAVAVPPAQGCCGALNLHSGDRETARRMARRNIDAFLDAGVERVVVASAGCGSAMKEYDHLLADDPEYAQKARIFAEMTADITEFLAELPLESPKGRIDARVTYQDPCHLLHAQRIADAPRRLLESIPGLELVPMEDSGRCCGAAGVYTITQRDMSACLMDAKTRDALATGADVVATANPGCAIQLQAGLKKAGAPVRVCHVVDLLDEAYGGARARP